MTIRIGDREAIKVRQFVRVATNLSLTAGTYATDIPPFNPLRLFAEDKDDPRRAEPRPKCRRRRLAWSSAISPLARRRGRMRRPDRRRRAGHPRGGAPGLRRGRTPAPPCRSRPSRCCRARFGQPEALGQAWAMRRIADAPFSTHRGARRPGERHQPRRRPSSAAPSPLVEERDSSSSKGETVETVMRVLWRQPRADRAPSPRLCRRGSRSRACAEGQRMRILIAPGPRLGDPRQIVRVVAGASASAASRASPPPTTAASSFR